MVHTEKRRMVSIPINPAGLVKMRDLRDFVEATEDVPEDYYASVESDEIRYETAE